MRQSARYGIESTLPEGYFFVSFNCLIILILSRLFVEVKGVFIPPAHLIDRLMGPGIGLMGRQGGVWFI